MQVVFLELCSSRVAVLSPQNLKVLFFRLIVCSNSVGIDFESDRLLFGHVNECCGCICELTLVFQVPTAGEMIDMWKKNHNAFEILYGWFLAKVCYFYP